MNSRNTVDDSGVLILPALRATMGDWVYYSTTMQLRDVAARVRLAKEVHESSSLDELIQRAVTDRAGEIADYLIQKEDRFFNTIVIGIYGGEPTFYEIGLRSNPFLDPTEVPSRVQNALGILSLSGSERLFAIDGQHRVVGIQRALQRADELGDDQVSAIFVAHRTDRAGHIRTRRLFTTLNRYAKPVPPLYIVALDEDDVSAIITRRLMDEHPLFEGPKVLPTANKALPRSAEAAFTNVVALNGAVDRYLRFLFERQPSANQERYAQSTFGSRRIRWTKFKRKRPSDEVLNEFYSEIERVWAAVVQEFAAVREIAEAKPGTPIGAKYRNEGGGHLLYRPIGLDVFFAALIRLMSDGDTVEQAVKKIASVPMTLDQPPWDGVLWSSAGLMITNPEAKRTAVAALVIGAGGKLQPRDFEKRMRDLRAIAGEGAEFRTFWRSEE